MNFHVISRLIYLRNARHRGGHGIHSPFLFRLITTVIEDKKKYPEYEIFEKLQKKTIKYLNNESYIILPDVIYKSGNKFLKPRKIYKKTELPLQYAKCVFRLIREFKPATLIHYGPTLGINLAVMALANPETTVYQSGNNAVYNFFTSDLLNDLELHNLNLLPENSVPTGVPEFVLIDYPDNPELARNLIQLYAANHGEDDVLIIRGIHQSQEMETLWQEIVVDIRVKVTLDLFGIGIVLFRKRSQKEAFILQF